jgi:hypothetical protein
MVHDCGPGFVVKGSGFSGYIVRRKYGHWDELVLSSVPHQTMAFMPMNDPGQQRFPWLRHSQSGYWYKIMAAVPGLGPFVHGSVAAVMIRESAPSPIEVLRPANR